VIEEFAEPIEYDFQHELAIDMLDFFRGYRSWRQFYNFLDRLPPHGHYKTAVAMSPKWAEIVLDMEEAGKGIPPGTEDHDLTPLGYTEVVARLDLIADRVMAVRTAVQAGYSKDHEEPRFEPMTRPVTAIDKERERRSRKILNEIESLIFGEGLSLSNIVMD
jgi:hypothetical protein